MSPDLVALPMDEPRRKDHCKFGHGRYSNDKRPVQLFEIGSFPLKNATKIPSEYPSNPGKSKNCSPQTFLITSNLG
jgi:hypothetical protein